ncbi:sulfatase [Pedobacter sp. BS3]|uniref:sulfatase n=1 Tax=Pedobacter sp. BS3 TaxID=2567937 RepID=UPI0011EC612A|nr:sulfatase [Pedobacter sp. BS3]TZF82255.1 sulfatase [Pedobacter sp. BS3]
MKKLIVYFLAFGLGLGLHAQTSVKKNTRTKPVVNKRMNVVFFLVDDMGWTDIAINGSKFYETPNIDRFAKENVRFTQAYAACHVCSPSRASMLTGKYPAHINLTDWLPGRKNFPFQKLQNVVVNQHIPYEEITLPEALKANGYRTAIIGKWHLGDDSASTARQGFDIHIPYGYNRGWPNKTYFSPYGMEGLEGGPDGEYLTDRITNEALKYIEQNKDNPFFLFLSHFAVHDPIQGRPDLVKKYQEKLRSMHYEGNPYILEGNPDTSHAYTRSELDALLKDPRYKGYGNLPNRIVKIKQFQDNVNFAAMVESVDESLGKVLAKLKALGIDDNTIVIFMSDNGGMSAMNMGNPKRKISPDRVDKEFSTANLPLRGGKGWMYEGGIREPMIMKWPNHSKKGAVCDVPVDGVDFYPTIMNMLGLKVPASQNVDGVDISPLLTGQNIEKRALYWHFPHYSNHGLQSPGGAIRYGDYKLLEYFENNTVQLFNLKNDPGEQHDLSKSEPAKVKELTTMLHNWRKKVGAKMMPPNPDYVRTP